MTCTNCGSRLPQLPKTLPVRWDRMPWPVVRSRRALMRGVVEREAAHHTGECKKRWEVQT